MKQLILLFAYTFFISSCAINSKKSTSIKKPNIKLISNWSEISADYKLGQPPAIDVDSEQNLFVFQRAHENAKLSDDGLIMEDAILVLDCSSGKIISSWGDNFFKKPHGLSVDENNNIWVTDLALQQVFKFSSKGELLLTLGEKNIAGNDATHFDQPTDAIASHDGFIYVADGYGNNRIVKFSPDGKYIKEWGMAGDADGEFNLPHSIDVDKFGNVYVADRQNNRIQKFDSDGLWIKTWADTSFGHIQSLKIDNAGKTLFAVDYRLTDDGKPKGSDILEINTENSEFKRIVHSEDLGSSPSRYHDIVLDSIGNIYVADIIKNKVHKFIQEE